MAERELIVRIGVEGVETASRSLEGLAKSEQDVAKGATAANTALDQTTKELTEQATATQQVTKQNQSLRTQLRSIQQELAKLALAGKANTKEYQRLRDEAGKLQDAIGDAAAEIRQAGSDTRGLDKAIRVASTATAAFGLVQGAAALFGKENEELQKSLLKVTAAISILTSLQQIQEEFNRKDSLFTLAAAKAKVAYAAATGGATGALKLFRLALIATGIGVFIVLVGALIANWDKLTAAFGRSEDRLKALNREFEKNKKIADDANKARELELALLEAQGVAEDILANKRAANAKERVKELRDEKLRLLELRQEEINRAKQEFFLFNAQKKRGESIAKIEEEYAKKLQEVEDAINSQRVTFVSAGTALTNFQKKRAEELRKNAEDARKAAEDQKREFEELFNLLDEIEKKYKQNLDNISKIGKGVSTTGGIKDLQELIAGLNEQLLNLAPGDPRQNALIILLKEAQAQLDELLKQLEEAKQGFTFKEPIIAPGTIKNTKQEIDAQKQQLSQFGLFRAALIRQQIKDTRDAGESTKALEEELFQANVQAANAIATQGLDFFTKIQNARLAILDNKLKQGLISEQEYQREVAELNRKQAVADKLKALFDIALNTAVGISAALRAVPPNPALAAVYGVLGAIQAGIVAATPIPKFRKGGEVLDGGRVTPEGMLSGRPHSKGGILIEAEGGEFITRRDMAQKYMPLLKAINSDKVDSIMRPQPIALTRTYKPFKPTSERQAEKRMNELIEEVRFLSQYVRQGNKWQRVTAESNVMMSKAKAGKHYV